MKFNISHAEAYDLIFPKHMTEHYTKKRVKFLRQFVNKNSRILDVGCGTGNIIIPLSKYVKESYGIDFFDRMIKKAKEKDAAKKIKLSVGSATKLKFKDNFFDLVYSIVTFHHIKTPKKVKKSISEMLRVTKLGGHIVIIDHNSKNPYWKILLKRIPWDKDVRLISVREFKQNFEGHKVRITPQSFVPEFCPKSMLGFFSVAEKFVENTVLGKIAAAHVAVIVKKIQS